MRRLGSLSLCVVLNALKRFKNLDECHGRRGMPVIKNKIFDEQLNGENDTSQSN